MLKKVIAATVSGILVAIMLSACSWIDDDQDDTRIKFTAAKCTKFKAEKIGKRSVQLTAKASWAKAKKAKNPIRGYVFRLVNAKKDAEPLTFFVPTSRVRATHTFSEVRPGKYSARVALQTSKGTLQSTKRCRAPVTIH